MFVNRKAATKPAEPERRIPTQERARQRVERILDAAASVFAEVGFDAATMETIAERAETSIGSIYQFFPNKLAVFDEITRRYHDKLRVFFDAMLSGPMLDQPLGDIVDASVEAVWSFHESEPGFRAVWIGLGGLTEQVVTEGEALNREIARRLEGVLGKKLPGLPSRTRPVVATMIVEILTAMLVVSTRRPARGPAIKAETKVLLRRYLEPLERRGEGRQRTVRSRR